MGKEKSKEISRKNFLRSMMSVGVTSVAGIGLLAASSNKNKGGNSEKVKVLTTSGELVEVNKSDVEPCCKPVTPKEARKGIPGQKFVLVADLARCKNARKCVAACDLAHHLTPDRPFIKVLKMQDSPLSSPYWMPKKCFQCDNPPCVKVCPVAATFKRSDGIVLIDNERCIGCRFCMAACPYSARVFNWGKPKPPDNYNQNYSPETSVPSKVGTVEKCDFCPDLLRQKKLPHCVAACPNGVLYFGNSMDDSVTNGSETLRLSTLLRDKAGYRYREDLGTQPSVYYLPPVDRIFPFKEKKKEDNAKV
jgi:Fe-S-cluster-containing dehydrogenase component